MADDLINALQQGNRSASVLQGIANPAQINPLAAITSGNQAAQSEFQTREWQAKQALGNILQQSTDPNGNVDYQKAHTMAAQAGPVVQMGMQKFAGDNSQLRGQQIIQSAGLQSLTAHMMSSFMNDASDAALERARQTGLAHGMPASMLAEIDRLKPLSEEQRRTEAYKRVTAQTDSMHQLAAGGFPTGTPTNVGGQIVSIENRPTTPWGLGGVRTGTGGVTMTASPDVVIGMADVVYPATERDVREGRASAVGADVRVSGADRVSRFGLQGLLPPGAREVPAAGGGGGGGQGAPRAPAVVRGADGRPVSPANPPRLLNVPGQPAPPAPAPAPAPTAVTPTPAPAPVTPPAPVGTNPTAPVVIPPPPAPPPTPLPSNAPRAALEGGVPVASANPLQVPETGAPGAQMPMTGSNVAAIQAGMAQARANPRPAGTQTAYSTMSVGPGMEEREGYKASADKLAADRLEATEFQNTQFPYVQALKNYGEGTKTGPTTEFWNQVAGSIRTPLAKLGINVGPLLDTTERVDALGKWLANIQSGSPISAKSDAMLAQTLKGSASTHINEVAGEDQVKAGLMLKRMKMSATNEWINNPDVRQQYGTYLNFLGNYNNTVDPRAFGVDMYNDAQKARLRDQLQRGTEEDAKRFKDTLDMARRNGVISGAGSRAMP